MRKFSAIVFIIAVSAVLVAVLPALAESQNWTWCDGNVDSVDLTIRGCTAIIRSGDDSRENLAIAFANRGMAYSSAKEFDRAIADCNQAVRLGHKLAAGYMCSGVVYEDKGEIDHAIAAYDKAIRVQSNDPESRLNRGRLYVKKNDYNHAIADFTAAIQIAPSFTAAYYNRGIAYSSKHDYDHAIADLTAAIRIIPDNSDYYNDRGEIYDKKHDYDRAIADYNAAIRLDPKYATAIENRGFANYENKDYNSAIADYDKLIKLYPKAAGVFGDRGAAYIKLRDYDKAISDFSSAFKLNPKSALALYGRGLAKQKKGDATGGEADITAAKTMRADVAEKFAQLFGGDVSAAEALPVCYQASVTLPTLEQQRAWLRNNKRYGPEAAAAYYTVAKRFGDSFIQYQIHYQPEPSGSLSSDIRDYNGIKVKGDGKSKSACHAPYVYLVGLKPVSIQGTALYVSENRGHYSVVSLGTMESSKRPFQLKLAAANKMLCKDFRRDMGYGVEDNPCPDLAVKITVQSEKQ